MTINMGSFGARLTRVQVVPDAVWTKVHFDEAVWDTMGGFDPLTGAFTARRNGKLHFAVGVRLLAPPVNHRSVELALNKNGKPRDLLARDAAFSKPDSVALNSEETPWAEYARGFSRGEVAARAGDVFEVYVRQGFGEPAEMTMRSPEPADGHASADRHPIYFMGVWHA